MYHFAVFKKASAATSKAHVVFGLAFVFALAVETSCQSDEPLVNLPFSVEFRRRAATHVLSHLWAALIMYGCETFCLSNLHTAL